MLTDAQLTERILGQQAELRVGSRKRSQEVQSVAAEIGQGRQINQLVNLTLTEAHYSAAQWD